MTQIRVGESHVSWLIFTSDRVYKVKKPVRFPFVDLSDPSARVEACRAEVRLNRRLAPDVYLGVGTFEDPSGSTEPVVVMRRMPEESCLATLVTRGDPRAGRCLIEVAGVLGEFHRRAERSTRIDSECTAPAVTRLWERNLEELRRLGDAILPGEQIEAVNLDALRYLSGRHRLFQDRIARGMAVDGHGDLLCDDIFCLADGPRLLDCLEFDDALRYQDVVADVASVCAELERLGRPDLAVLFAAAYRRESRTEWPPSLEHYYVAYRATVRSKIACIRASDSGGPTDADEARRLLDVASRHLREATVRLVLVGGLPGTGKSTLAGLLAGAKGWPVLSTDQLRKELAGIEAHTSAATTFEDGIYTPEMTERVYSRMLVQAGHLVSRGQSVILDASWRDPAVRRRAADLADATFSELVAIECRAPRDVAVRRLEQRAATGTDPSDASVAVRDEIESTAVPWPEARAVDTTLPRVAVLSRALEALG